MSEQELNKRLAEWVGEDYWYAEHALPYFPHSPSGCFTQLVPPLEGFYIIKYRDEFLAVAVKDGRCGQAFHKEAAMAICLAIDKMLEGK